LPSSAAFGRKGDCSSNYSLPAAQCPTYLSFNGCLTGVNAGAYSSMMSGTATALFIPARRTYPLPASPPARPLGSVPAASERYSAICQRPVIAFLAASHYFCGRASKQGCARQRTGETWPASSSAVLSSEIWGKSPMSHNSTPSWLLSLRDPPLPIRPLVPRTGGITLVGDRFRFARGRKASKQATTHVGLSAAELFGHAEAAQFWGRTGAPLRHDMLCVWSVLSLFRPEPTVIAGVSCRDGGPVRFGAILHPIGPQN
jgi:hypothetical protein